MPDLNQNADLANRLRNQIGRPDAWHLYTKAMNDLLGDAASTVEAQAAEISRLRDALKEAQGVLARLSQPNRTESLLHVYAAVVAAEVRARTALEAKP